MKTHLTAAMDNVDAWRLGETCLKAASPEQRVGDYIDRGLILRRLLEENGYGIVKLAATQPVPADEADGEDSKELLEWAQKHGRFNDAACTFTVHFPQKTVMLHTFTEAIRAARAHGDKGT